MKLTAPFPYFGGKRRWSDTVWDYLGNPEIYLEPFAGSLACLLSRPGGPGRQEVVCDTEGGIVNFWRAIQNDPDSVVIWADHPTFHDDLLSRKKWFWSWSDENAFRLQEDMDYYDAKAAGIWAWGLSVSIASSWMFPKKTCIPYTHSGNGGQGCSSQAHTKPDLYDWFSSIANRMKRVTVMNRSWESCLTPTILGVRAPKSWDTGILMDPPYRNLDTTLYSEYETSVSEKSYQWAVEHGERYRIAYCCHEGDFDVPQGWTPETMSMSGHNNLAGEGHGQKTDMIMFSPACLRRQSGLFD